MTNNVGHILTGDTRKIIVSKTVDESHSSRVLIGCKTISHIKQVINIFYTHQIHIAMLCFYAYCTTSSERALVIG